MPYSNSFSSTGILSKVAKKEPYIWSTVLELSQNTFFFENYSSMELISPSDQSRYWSNLKKTKQTNMYFVKFSTHTGWEIWCRLCCISMKLNDQWNDAVNKESWKRWGMWTMCVTQQNFVELRPMRELFFNASGPETDRGAFFDSWLSICQLTLRRATIKVRHERPLRSPSSRGRQRAWKLTGHCAGPKAVFIGLLVPSAGQTR